jgi:hypothetical protein
VFRRAGRARRFAFSCALAQFMANHDQWAAEATYDIPKPDRTRPLSYFDLVRRWDATRSVAAVACEQSVWTLRYGIWAAHTGALAFPDGPVQVPQVQGPTSAGPGSRPPAGCTFSQAGYGSPSSGGSISQRSAVPGAGQAPAPAGTAPGLDTEHHREHGRKGHLVGVGCFQPTMTAAPQAYSRPAGAAVGVDVGITTARSWPPPAARSSRP